MLTLTAHTKISELQSGPPGVINALRSTGLYHDGDDTDVMLGELCWTFGFNPGMLLMMLESANVPEEKPPIDVTPFQNMPLASLVEHVEKTHHHYLRENLPKLTALANSVAVAHADNQELSELDEEMQRIAVELDTHMLHEEESLFSMIRELATNHAVTPTRCGGSVGGPIACMENEHELTVKTLLKMRKLTNNYLPTDGISGAWRELLERLAAFDQDLLAHMYKEDKVLFPRALAAQRGSRAAAAG
ncbi:MAG: hemerythrin domain-containing protein [Gammaproteobacteria bacterium]